MTGFGKAIVVSILAILLVFIFPSYCFGNSAEPPSILIIAANLPDDAEIGIVTDTSYLKASIRKNIIEKYYVFYSIELGASSSYTLKVKTDKSTFEIPIKAKMKTYNNIFTLDFKNRTLVSGKLLSRSIVLVVSRLTMTLMIEGLIFYFMGYRSKRSWIIFFAINIITQGALNIWLNGFSPTENYIIIALVLGEFFVFIFEIIAFLAFLKEHRWYRTLLFVILANMLSLAAGGYVISILPI
jgi:hypothetical protein